jgi:hypothetical protein
MWATATPDMRLYASHSDFIKRVIAHHEVVSLTRTPLPLLCLLSLLCSSATTRSSASSNKPVLTAGGTGGVGVERQDKLRSPYVWRVPLMAGLLRDLCVLGDVSMSDGLFDVVCSFYFLSLMWSLGLSQLGRSVVLLRESTV